MASVQSDVVVVLVDRIEMNRRQSDSETERAQFNFVDGST